MHKRMHNEHPRGRHMTRGSHGHKGGPHGRGRGRGRSRVSRGDVRLSVLILLQDESMHGYQIMQELETRTDGAWQPSPGSIYPTLQQLADEGLIISEASGGKNVFSLTDAGREAAASIEGPAPWERVSEASGSGHGDLRRAIFAVGAASKQVASTGSAEAITAATQILSDARKALYGLLASDDPASESDVVDDA